MSAKRSVPQAPEGLGNSGRRLWKAILEDLHEDAEFDARELAILAAAARQADLVKQLETALKKDGVVVRGSAGQPRLNAVATELRQCRLALARLLGDLGLEDAEAFEPPTARSRRASRASRARWDRQQPRLTAAPEER